MSHHVYHTRALVMRAIPSGEADMTLELFTKDWGRITAHTRGLRREASRLRYILQPMSWVLASVVRGAGGWRLTTANPDSVPPLHRGGRSSLARVTRIVQKFFPHEVMSQQVFDGLILHTQKLVESSVRANDWEVVTLARMFQHLGYWGEETTSIAFLEDGLDGEGLTENERAKLVREINRILRTVHT